MIDFDLGKLVLLALIALVVLGPEKLPQVARTAGALLRRVRGSWDSVRAEVERELEIEEIRRTARAAAAQAEAAQQAVRQTAREVREPIDAAATELAALRSRESTAGKSPVATALPNAEPSSVVMPVAAPIASAMMPSASAASLDIAAAAPSTTVPVAPAPIVPPAVEAEEPPAHD